MSIFKNAKTFLHANLFIILPPIIIIIFTIIITVLFGDIIDFLTNQDSTCDGSSSFNICEIGIILILASIGSFFLSRYILKASHIKSKSPIYGIGLFYGIPIILLFIHWNLTNGIYGNARGTITDWIIFISIPAIVIGLLFLSLKNYHNYQKRFTKK